MRFAVFGAGGIGGYLGGRLAQAGEDVAIIARGNHLTAIRNQSLRVDSIKGNFVFGPSIATDKPAGSGTSGYGIHDRISDPSLTGQGL